jgi:hypothetical protein
MSSAPPDTRKLSVIKRLILVVVLAVLVTPADRVRGGVWGVDFP